MNEQIRPETIQPARRRRLRRALVALAATAAISFGGIAAASGMGNAALTDPARFIQMTGAVLQGDESARDWAKYLVAESGRDPVCQQAIRQTLEQVLQGDNMGAGSVFDIPSSLAGYAFNNRDACMYGLTGVTEAEIDVTAEMTDGFPDLAGFDRTVMTRDGVIWAEYSRNNELIGTIVNLDGTAARLVSPDEFDSCVADTECRQDIVGGVSVMASAAEEDYSNDFFKWPYLPWIQDSTPGTWVYGNLTLDTLKSDDSYTTLTFTLSDGDYHVGPFTQDLHDDIAANGGFMMTSPFNLYEGEEFTADRNFNAGAVFKQSGIMAVCSGSHGDYLMAVRGNQQSDDGAAFFMSAGYTLTNPDGNCAVADDEGNQADVVMGQPVTPTQAGNLTVIRTSENRVNPFMMIVPAAGD
ncbi:MAG: hypothetical protein TR69_WS6001000545 [candidate division WS6 bacterium OLB20]|uniref:Uncharacterized protein n=1 Tax=candidate division WS6 bacterium OLB20 TaxID=1617426 RepID=A0A136LY04_9BACT|nr:MAG: hypothetical protein TR69_WS6001000545 [candidate division WS6 bacterium OLB20]